VCESISSLADELLSDEESFAEQAPTVIEVTAAMAGVRLDRLVAEQTDVTRTAAVRRIESGEVVVNGRRAEKKYPVREGDAVTVAPTPPPTPSEVLPEDIPLDIVYEDADLLVINKPSGMVVHPAPGHTSGTLVNALLHHCAGELSGIGGVLRPGIVHRIDKDTGGLLVVAKNDRAHRALAAQLEGHHIEREYRALAIGGFRDRGGTVNAPIGRHPTDRKRMAVIRDLSHPARTAVTHYEVLESFGQVSYIRCRLETGRTHQIRVHMAYLGHPLLGDTVYCGGRTPFEKRHASLLSGQALFAKRLRFTHPTSGETVSFEVPLPDDMEKLLAILRTQS